MSPSIVCVLPLPVCTTLNPDELYHIRVHHAEDCSIWMRGLLQVSYDSLQEVLPVISLLAEEQLQRIVGLHSWTSCSQNGEKCLPGHMQTYCYCNQPCNFPPLAIPQLWTGFPVLPTNLSLLSNLQTEIWQILQAHTTQKAGILRRFAITHIMQ